ncbi:hypothetical protein [Streptomyces sp.]|uniref:hypothetical protein n=1 Tax=Streptomyces sp. TaxID=1931 RepID=UPI002D78A56E|nr:hypothetical protein [Streptomyces sp.]HET6360232.1 hypothetical protein [Streptomyces sp.]
MNAVTLGLVAVALSAGCSSSGESPDNVKTPATAAGIPSKYVCGGLSPLGSQALELVTGAKQYSQTSSSDMESLANEVAAWLKGGPASPADFCRIKPLGVTSESAQAVVPDSEMHFVFERVAELPPAGSEAKGSVSIPVGLQAVGTSEGADIYFRCIQSGETANPKSTPIVRSRLQYSATSNANVYKDNVKLLQDVTHKLVVQLRCEGDAGIPER